MYTHFILQRILLEYTAKRLRPTAIVRVWIIWTRSEIFRQKNRVNSEDT